MSPNVHLWGLAISISCSKREFTERSNSSLNLFLFLFLQQTKSYTVDLRAKPEYHKFLIGKGGGNIRKVRDNTGARIIFPTNEDKDQELITIMGTEEAVKEAQKELEVLIRNLVSVIYSILFISGVIF